MVDIYNKNQLSKRSDLEIEEFFEEAIFEGVFSTHIKSQYTDSFKGSVSDIKLDGHSTDIVPGFLNVPVNSNEITPGPCVFKCRPNLIAIREKQNRPWANLRGNTLQQAKLTDTNIEPIKVTTVLEKDLCDCWGVDNCDFIGFYHFDEKINSYVVEDLRKPNFDHIPYYPLDSQKRPIRIKYPHQITGIKEGDYYLFTWKLSHRNPRNPYEIFIDFSKQPRPIQPKWFIAKLFEDRHNDKSKNFGSARNFLDTLSKQLSANESTFVYELLQNANDYPVEGKMVDVEFHITDNYLLFLHSGDKFNVRNISGICGINEKEKVANKRTIGYKGIGFKTVFLHNRYVYIQTGDYSFRFDEGETIENNPKGKIKRVGAPYQVLPIWTESHEVSSEVSSIFDQIDDKYNVRLALRPESKRILHTGKNSYETLFRDIFADANIILFIPNINSVKVIINGREERVCYRNSADWEVGHYEEDIDSDLQEAINLTIDKGTSRIPEKYKDFDATKVSFACKHEDSIIKPVDKATIYCYLPTKASWGFPFLMNTDMIPKGDRNDIETEVELLYEYDTNFNEELASIAGSKLFSWIYDLLRSCKYQLGSVFSLVPDFKKCKREHDFYEDFIDKFEVAFNIRVERENIIPVKRGFANIKHVVMDTTGLTTSGIMTDEEFLRFSGHEEHYLPLPQLREDKNFNAFLKTYVDKEQKFTENNLSSLIANEKFKKWLSIEDNNHKFLKFLLEKGYLQDLVSEEIFLDVSGFLCSAEDLYYDVDEYLSDLASFTKYLWYLSPNTRKYFAGNNKWESIIDNFLEFDCDEFVDYLLDNHKSDIIEILQSKEPSIHFYKFLAENVTFKEEFTDLPFISSEDEVVSDFNDKLLFFSSADGIALFEADWLASIDAAFVSEDYAQVTLDYFEKNFGVIPFTEEYLIENVILDPDYNELISSQMEDNFVVSKEFMDFCYAHKNLFENNSLSNFALSALDKDGDSSFVLTEDVIFFPSQSYLKLATKKWMKYDWTYALDENYFENIKDLEDFKKFLSKSFGVLNFSDKVFYQKVVKKHLPEIFELTSGSNDSDGSLNFDFVSYLDRNYQLIFEEENDAAKFKSFIIVSNEGEDTKIGKTLYLYDAELDTLQANEWFPEDVITLCNKKYGKSRSLTAIGCQKYKFQIFYDSIIVPNLRKINNRINNKELSIAFHSFILDRMEGLTSKQIEEMRNAKLFLYGKNTPVAVSSGHRILNDIAVELFDQHLVMIDDVDIIDPDYHAEDNIEYWENRLGNTQYGIEDFFEWLQSNSATFNERIGSFEQNKIFYRWLKDIADEDQLEVINDLHLTKFIVKKEGSAKSSTIYFPDDYMSSGGIEDLVKLFDPNASFITPSYIEDDDDIDSWYSFWSQLGIKSDILDILCGTVIPNLTVIENDQLPRLIAENRTQLEALYPDSLIKNLQELKVKGAGGDFYSIKDTIYIDCDLGEPFTCVSLPNVINFDSKEEKRLIKDILDEVGGKRISTLSEWQQEKVDYYIQLQSANENAIRGLHYTFVRELAEIQHESKDRLKQISGTDNILLLGRDNLFHKSKDLTMGSIYRPRFDFEQCGIDLPYISDSYKENGGPHIYGLLNCIGVHSDFVQEDIHFLVNRACAIYFWTQYVTKKNAPLSKIREWISKQELNNIACIPTKDCMKKPTQLYYGVNKPYLKSIEDWENKVPLQDIPEIILSDESNLLSHFPFGRKLKFEDALFALRSKGSQTARKELLQWLIDDYDRVRHTSIIAAYRDLDEASWYNNNNDSVQIKDLYALDNSDKSLHQYLGSDSRIINDTYFPSGKNFRLACDILGIETIETADLVVDFVDEKTVSTEHHSLTLYALVIAGVTDASKWEELYVTFCEKISQLIIHSCSKINITCKQDRRISKALKKFYHKSNDFYYVENKDSWHDNRVYTEFCKAFAGYIGADEITEDHLINIMHSPEDAVEFIEENNALKLDEKFKNELDKFVTGVTKSMTGNNHAVDTEMPDIPTPHRTIKEDDDQEEHLYADEKQSDDFLSPNEKTSAPFTPETDEYEDDEDDDEFGADIEDDFSDEENEENLQLSDEEDYDFDGDYDASIPEGFDSLSHEFVRTTVQHYLIGAHEEVVCEHYRGGTWVRDHYRNGHWVSGHWRGGSYVGAHSRMAPEREFTNTLSSTYTSSGNKNHSTEVKDSYGSVSNNESGKSIGVSNKSSDDVKNQFGSSEREANPSLSKRTNSFGKSEHNELKPRSRTPKPYSKSDPAPLQLESLPATDDELNILASCGISPEQIADTNYLANLRLYQNLKSERKEEPEESLEAFIRNADNVASHKMKSGKYVHACSAARGVMYIGPSVWEKMVDDKWVICVYLNGQGKKFHYINSREEFLALVEKDDIIIKITGKEKIDVVNQLYNGILHGVKGSAYTLIRVAAQTSIDTVFARYVGAMAEDVDGNDELNEDDY